ncbi:MAG: redoxin domain-containing protein [Sediminibacterium sp.]|jgi:thiol-disulfide isomerase/thioredoxin
MKNWICLVLLLSGLVEQSVAQVKKPTSSVGHAIQVSLKPYQNTKIYIGTNYGNNKVLADSCVLNEKSEGVFKGAQKLTPGIYFLVNPKYNILFDFLVDEAQNFKIVADTNNLSNYSIVGSSENDLFKEYSVAVNKIGSELAAIENKFKTATTSADSSLYRTQYISKDKELKDQRSSFMKAHPKSMMSYLLNVMQRPEAPAIPVINGKADSLYPFYYVKNHFWDDVVFNDNRLIRTPFFEAKLDEYFKNYVARDADSIIEEVQYMLTVAKTGKEIYPFLLFKFTNKYISPEFMGQDKVFLHLYQNFFAKGDTVLLNEASKKSITERAYSMMANQLGLPAPALDINTIDDKPFSLYKTAAPYTFIAFWDPTCSHCKVEIPQLDSMYKASWKALGVQIVGVNINYKELPAWKKFIADNQINNWFHVYQTEAALNKEITNQKPTTIRQLYDVFKTPTFYLLDANKRIIAKNLTLNQFDDFLKSKAKK